MIPKENKLGVENHWAFPQTINAVCPAAAETKNTTLPPTLSAAARSPRRHTVIAASKTKMTRAHMLKSATANHGFGTRRAVAEIVSPRIGSWLRLEISR